MRFGYALLGLVTLAALHASNGACSNGLPGVQYGSACCDAGCGTCGGASCDYRPGGKDNCCYTDIMGNGVMCSATSAAPCIVDPTCSNGLPGHQYEYVCCEEQCETCAGGGCDQRPGGSNACCFGTISTSGNMCSATSAAPCIIDPTCDNGLAGVQSNNICCEPGCGVCGDSECEDRPGGEDACCESTIEQAGNLCSTTMAAPCIINDLNIEEI